MPGREIYLIYICGYYNVVLYCHCVNKTSRIMVCFNKFMTSDDYDDPHKFSMISTIVKLKGVKAKTLMWRSDWLRCVELNHFMC